MRKKNLALLITLLLYGSACLSQALQVHALTVASGLSQGFVSCIFEDHRGFIWIGTFNGLNRYDGYEVKRFTPDNTGRWSLKANFIYCIAEDAQGLLWIGTDKGPVVLDPYTERFVQLAEIAPALPAGEVIKIICATDNRIWLCHRQPGQTGVCVVRPPADLLRLVREDPVNAGAFEVLPVGLSAGLERPLMGLYLFNDSIFAASDARSQLCRIDPANLRAQRVDPRQLPHQVWGNYGLFFSRKEHHGYVFMRRDVAGGQPGNVNQVSEFFQLPDETLALVQPRDSTVCQLDTFSSHLELPGNGRSEFYRQYQPLLRLDQAVSEAMLVDRLGNVWLGTIGYGARKISSRKLVFRQYLPYKSVYNFTFLPDGRVWPGIYCQNKVFNLHTGQLEPAPWVNILHNYEWEYNLFISRTGVWWLTKATLSGLQVLRKSRQTEQWEEQPLHLTKFENVPVQFFEDRQGNIWIAGNRGEIARIRPAGKQVSAWNISRFFPGEEAQQLRSTCLTEDKHGLIWIGCNFGLIQVSNPNGEPAFQAFHNHSNKGTIFKSDWILGAFPDPEQEHILWLGTRGGGLIRLDWQTLNVETFTEKEGLTNNVVYGILPDSSGYLWLSTNRGLCRFNPRNHTFASFQQADPAINTEFNTGAYSLLPSGEMAFGSIAGLFIFRPPSERQTDRPALVAVTSIDINGQPLEFPCTDGCLQFNTGNDLALRLPYDQNNIAIAFAALQTTDPSIVQYRYRVTGLSAHWVPVGSQRSANLVGLPPGEYVLELQAKDPDDDWDMAVISRLPLTILPPWYRSLPAWLAYALALLLLIRMYIRFVRKRLALEHAIDLGKKEMEQLKTLDDFKNRFFAYISHEFKTPLTIILGMADRLSQGKNAAQTPAYAQDIILQGRNMLELVDQLVDITRLEEKQLHLNWQQGNFSAYIRYLVESYRPLAGFRDLQLECACDSPDIIMDFDPLRLKYILSNLLTNAIRHTPSGGSIRVRLGMLRPAEFVRLEVSDTGEGISAADMPHIFERYFRGGSGAPSGTPHFGLGLAFVRELVQLFNGAIGVSSHPGHGTSIAITLPVSRSAPLLDIWAPGGIVPASGLVGDIPAAPLQQHGLPQLLVVEDNPVISDYLQLCLRPHFQLTLVADGLLGWDYALEHLPDLVLTDVMLPGIDGLELTRRIKSHELTDHIPVVMLSARSELEDRLSGQRLGADAYLAKPFHEQELILVLQNLYNLQRRWQKRFTGQGTAPAGATASHTLPIDALAGIPQKDAFRTRLYAVFEKNYSQENYGLPQLCRDLKISKSQLQRKLAALSGQSAMQLLRHYRLQKAYILLQAEPNLNVKEVCFQVGFKDPAHFSKLFTKAFGQAPSKLKED